MSNLHPSRRQFLFRSSLAVAAGYAAAAARWPALADPAMSDDERLFDMIGQVKGMSGVVGIRRGSSAPIIRAWGMADQSRATPNSQATSFNLASLGKLFTSVAIGQLKERGLLDWNDRITAILPGLPESFCAITIEHLLTHRSGLGTYFGAKDFEKVRLSGRSVADYLPLVTADTLAFPPGQGFAYSNNGFVLLGAVIEKLQGTTYEKAIRKMVLGPCAMHDTVFARRDQLPDNAARGYTAGCFARPPSACTPGPATENSAVLPYSGGPAGGVYSTAPDLFAFADALRRGALLRKATLADMLTPRFAMEQPGAPLDAQGLGFGLVRVGNTTSYGHNGGTPGAAAQLDITDDPQITTVVLCNSDGPQRRVSAILRSRLYPKAEA